MAATISSPPLPAAPAKVSAPFPASVPLRARAYLVALPLLVLTCFLSVYADMVSKVVQFGVLQFAPPAIALLFFVALCNRALKRRGAGWLNSSELLTIYAMQLVAVLVSTRGVVEKLIPPLAYLPYFANRENKLGTSIEQHLPAWAMPFVPSAQSGNASLAMSGFWEGNDGHVPWSTWIGPLCAWFVLVGCAVLVFLCLSSLLRRQWMDNEQLTFPLTALPLAIITDQSEKQPFFSNRSMWAGAACTLLLFGINGWAANNPDVPKFVTEFGLAPFFSEAPWTKVDGTSLFISPAAIGFAFFLPLDLLFSFWFFHWFCRLQAIPAEMFGGQSTGIGTHNATIFTGFQAAGAYLVLIATYTRIAWPFFKAAWKTAFGRNKPLDDSDELMSYRSAFLGIGLGFVGIVVWLALAGMNPFLAAAQMGLYLFFIAVIMSRAVTEGGLLMTETSFLPSHLINLVAPLPGFSATSLTMLGMTNIVFARDLRGILLSAFLDCLKIAKEVKMRPRALLLPLLSAVVLSSVLGSGFFLYFHYKLGGLSLYGYPRGNAGNMFNTAAAQISGTSLPNDLTAWGGLAMGVVLTLFLVFMRARFAWFPFHPLGYAVAPTWAMIAFWFPFFIAWVIKSAVMRFGGIDTYRKICPFMLGLILGEFGSAVFWSLMNIWRAWNAPSFPWP